MSTTDAQHAAPQPIYLKDYRPPAWLVEDVKLTFRLDPTATRVLSRIRFVPNPDAPGAFKLDGEKLKLISAAIDGVPVEPEITDTQLTCKTPDGPFTWEAEVEIDPQGNTTLEGLYMSNGMYCTQCEAEGFRKITYYPDRPDVMAPFSVRIESDLPVLLSNGNPGKRGDAFAEWIDPWPKPAYLFALVAGELVAHEDSFTTAGGKDVDLAIWVREADIGKCAFGMDALKRSMLWDEQVYGREYDLDVFNIVAVDDFNMGAMENKGLNIFNSAAVLASPETATDANFERIESIIAHEYFHNWTGNRITCRDWFQLCLKEGLTVFRDQQFSADERSAAVRRIDDVLALRARQFREDNGPLAHPVRPQSFVEINNFYTATVYEKGAELIRMLKRLVGDNAYYEALELYFARHDGQACTIEDWLAVFEDATGRDLSQFKRWYSQAGTPRVYVTEDWRDGSYTLQFHQETPPTPGQDEKRSLVIPVAVGLLAQNGSELRGTEVLELTSREQSFTFENLPERPVPSILREFSAPVILHRNSDKAERLFLLRHDTDSFNKWEAARGLMKDCLTGMALGENTADEDLLSALADVLRDDTLDPAFRALVLQQPSEDDIAQTLFEANTTPDPTRIHQVSEQFANAFAAHAEGSLASVFTAMKPEGVYAPDAQGAGRRALLNASLTLLSRRDGGERAAEQYDTADNMTLQLGSLSALLRVGSGISQLERFYDQWADDRLVLDKWFSMQVALATPGDAARIATDLAEHPKFDWKNPNRFRAVVGGLASNAAGFHHASGKGYDFVSDWLIRLDPVNPQTTARMSTVFETWRRYDADRQDLMRAALGRIQSSPGLSRDTGEMVARILEG
ncbi:aminopeptidase N [Qingshengfaniella alkalisoli]|uniref:Aminopeptidase N n=1 Tax=Qingshengfaniella alkalisoli TaxID=2599296 RepID=A0A5B8IXR7_9RHOB|nr:aminopeptidase N [Qingshengfaniella alkalisoli]QDY69428.1 aminopeptidase N [Qingshengfaniella alkalisoli]